MIDCKIRVNSPEESRMIQEYLFGEGVKWNSHKEQGEVQFTEKQILYVRRGKLSFGESQEVFTEDNRPELKFKFGVISDEIVCESKKMTLKEVEEALGYKVELVSDKGPDDTILWGYV